MTLNCRRLVYGSKVQDGGVIAKQQALATGNQLTFSDSGLSVYYLEIDTVEFLFTLYLIRDGCLFAICQKNEP